MTQETHWTLAERAAKMNPSVIREILKVTEKPGIISFAGGLPSSKTFPVAEFEAACAKVLKDDPAGALQYAASEGYGPLRELVAARRQGLPLGDARALQAYASAHRRTTLPTYVGTNAIVKLFTNDRPAAHVLRHAILQVSRHLPPLKAAITRQLTEIGRAHV